MAAAVHVAIEHGASPRSHFANACTAVPRVVNVPWVTEGPQPPWLQPVVGKRLGQYEQRLLPIVSPQVQALALTDLHKALQQRVLVLEVAAKMRQDAGWCRTRGTP